MKKLIALVLALCLCLLCGCGGNATETEAPTTEAPVTEAPVTQAPETAVPTTEAPTEAPTEPPIVYTNPLTGEIMDGPLQTRIFGVTVDNVHTALPHVNLDKADMVFEMYINDYSTRCLALYTDITKVDAIGAVRSNRVNFTDIAQGYDAIIAHAGGSDYVMTDARKSGIDHFNVDVAGDEYYAFRDTERQKQGISRVHCLMAKGPGVYQMAAEKGMRVTQDPEKTYGLSFTETPCPADGETANVINISFNLYGHTKPSAMTYDASLGEYLFSQYGKDPDPENPEAFKNVFVLLATVKNVSPYHIADIVGNGTGYFACEGKMIPILWVRENEHDPFTFTRTDGTPLSVGIGSSYVAIAPTTSTVSAK